MFSLTRTFRYFQWSFFWAARYFTQETYVKDVTAAGATPVKFDDYFTRWEELMEDQRTRFPMNKGGPKKLVITGQ